MICKITDQITTKLEKNSLELKKYVYIYIFKQVGELLKSWVNGCLIQNCFVAHRKGNPLLS